MCFSFRVTSRSRGRGASVSASKIRKKKKKKAHVVRGENSAGLCSLRVSVERERDLVILLTPWYSFFAL